MTKGQKVRLAVYIAASPLTLIGLLSLGDYRWIVVAGFVAVLLMGMFERCPSCGGALFGPKRSPEGGTWICKSCWHEGGRRTSGISDPEPPQP